MTKEMLEKYSPYNAKNLTQEDLAEMASFTKEDVKALAEEYPNKNFPSAYLILKDKTKPENKQLFPLSTWKNFYELLKLNQSQFVAHSFKSIFRPKAAPLKAAPVQDLTNAAAKQELKTAGQQTANETKKPEVPPASDEQTAKQEEKKEVVVEEPVLTAEQIAAKEGAEISGAGEEGETQASKEVKPEEQEKPLNKMNLLELQGKYKQVTGEDADPSHTKAMLVAAINKAPKK